jgi:hypothetical protein
VQTTRAATCVQLVAGQQSTFYSSTMSDNNKYQPPSGPPPTYPQQVHVDAGPYDSRGPGSPTPQNQIMPYPQQESFGGPQGQYGPPGQYGYPQQPFNQGWGGGPPPGVPPPGGMYYQQQPPMGYYQDPRGGYGPGSQGICAGLLGALACCCCLELLF